MAGDISLCTDSENLGGATISLCPEDSAQTDPPDIVVCPEQQPLTLSGPQSCFVDSVYVATGGVGPYSWEIVAVEESSSLVPSWATTTNPVTNLDDGSAKIITGISGCCGSGIITVTDSLNATAEKTVRFPYGSWRLTHFHGAFIGEVPFVLFETPNQNLDAAISQCCLDISGDAVAKIHRVDDVGFNDLRIVGFTDGDIAYQEYVLTFYTDGLGGGNGATPGADSCPESIKNLPTDDEQDAAAVACGEGSLWPTSGKDAIDWWLPAGHSQDDYEIADWNEDHKILAVSRIFYQWQCDRYGAFLDVNYFRFSGITP